MIIIHAIDSIQAFNIRFSYYHFVFIFYHLGKFSDRLAELTQPLRELLSKGTSWTWDSAQNTAFRSIKVEITKPKVLTHYDVNCSAMRYRYVILSANLKSDFCAGQDANFCDSPVVGNVLHVLTLHA